MGTRIENKTKFVIRIEADELDGGFVAECLNLPGCASHGDTEREAVENLVEAIAGVLEARMQRHLERELSTEKFSQSGSRIAVNQTEKLDEPPQYPPNLY